VFCCARPRLPSTDQTFCAAGTNNITKVARNVHEGSVFSICALKDGSVITGGGKDGKLIKFDASMHPTGYEAQVRRTVLFTSLTLPDG